MAPAESAGAEPGAPRRELAELCAALRVHLESLADSGAWGLPAAPKPVARERAAAVAPPQERAAPARVAPPTAQRAVAERAAPAPSPAAGSPPPRPALPMAQAARLAQLTEEARTCTRCALHSGRIQSVFARGSGSSGLVFVGEGPGEEEDRRGEPFVGPAGQLLDRMIAAMQLGRDEVYVCNIVKCRPPGNRKPELEEMKQCRPYLDEQLTLLQPRVIVALGATAVQGLLGTTDGITRLRGQWKLYRGTVPVMPTFHPAYLLRQPSAKREVWDDLREVLKQLERGRGTAAPAS